VSQLTPKYRLDLFKILSYLPPAVLGDRDDAERIRVLVNAINDAAERY
jgi:hypothetical protein